MYHVTNVFGNTCTPKQQQQKKTIKKNIFAFSRNFIMFPSPKFKNSLVAKKSRI